MHLKLKKIDKPLLVATILLTIFGILMVYSASNVVALEKYNDSLYFFKRQGLFLGLSYIAMILILNFDISKLEK